MKRREFLKSVTAMAAGGVLPAAPAVWSPVKAQSRQETLLIVSESGPNNIDIHGVGTNVPGYEVSWNCYDRLISHEMKTLPSGVGLTFDAAFVFGDTHDVNDKSEAMALGIGLEEDYTFTVSYKRDFSTATGMPEPGSSKKVPCWPEPLV